MPAVHEQELEGFVDVTDPATMLAVLQPRCEGRLLRLARGHTDDPDTAEDLVQEAYLKLLLHPPRLDTVAACEAWLLRVARNHFIDHVRRSKVERRRRSEFSRVSTVEASDGRAGTAQHEIVARALARDELSDQILQAIAALPPRQRSVVNMRCILGQSTTATAVELGLARGTVRATLFQARAALRLCLVPGHG